MRGGCASANTREEIGVDAAYPWRQTTISGLFANTRFEALGSAAGPNPLGYTGTASFGLYLEISPAGGKW